MLGLSPSEQPCPVQDNEETAVSPGGEQGCEPEGQVLAAPVLTCPGGRFSSSWCGLNHTKSVRAVPTSEEPAGCDTPGSRSDCARNINWSGYVICSVRRKLMEIFCKCYGRNCEIPVAFTTRQH